MDTKDLSHHREMEIEPKNVPSNNETIEMLFEYFDQEYKKHEASAYDIACEANLHLDEKTTTDVISMDIRHNDVADIPLYYFPFNILEDGEVKYRESFAVKR